MTAAQYVSKWDIRFATNDTFQIDEEDLREFAHDTAETFGVVLANVPAWSRTYDYPLGYLVRYGLPGGTESFYYSLGTGLLPHPTIGVSSASWRIVPGPVPPTTLYQYITLAEAQGIDNDSVVAGRRYGVAGKWNGVATDQLVFLDGLDLSFRRRGTLFRNDGTQLEVEVSVGLGTFQVVGGGGGTQLVEISSDATYRVARVKLRERLVVQDVVVQTSANAGSYLLQVSAYRAGSWVAGTPRSTVAAAQADLDALTPADYLAGAELEVKTVPVASGAAATLLLPVAAGADCFAFLTSTRANLRTNNNAPPAGYAGVSAYGLYEETDSVVTMSGGWQVSPGAAYSGGACLYVRGNNPGTDLATIKFWFVDACRFDLVGLTDPTLGIITMQLDGAAFDTANQQANPGNAHTYYTSPLISPGEHTLVVSGEMGRTFLWDAIRFYVA